MMVQLLVENGIKHGVAARVEGGEIRVSAAARDGRLQIVTRSSGRLASGPNDEGVGLRNARERLRLLYGDRGTLSLREESAGVVVAELGLPIEADREENGARADRR
jgi:LytS/YehU family sensor histidine kinase